MKALAHSMPEIHIFPEPVHEWTEWLDLFYKDTKRWAFAFQMKVLSSFVRPYPDGACVIERSMLAARHVFGQLLFNQNLLAQKEWDLFRSMAEMHAWEPDAIIYINCPPEVCLERMHARGRPAEHNVSLEYLSKVDFMYRQMLKYFAGKVIQVDGNRPIEQVTEDVLLAVQGLVHGT
jgi:deoxyadenosine/deoxycytidine kinase